MRALTRCARAALKVADSEHEHEQENATEGVKSQVEKQIEAQVENGKEQEQSETRTEETTANENETKGSTEQLQQPSAESNNKNVGGAPVKQPQQLQQRLSSILSRVHVVDATAGLGADMWVIASRGTYCFFHVSHVFSFFLFCLVLSKSLFLCSRSNFSLKFSFGLHRMSGDSCRVEPYCFRIARGRSETSKRRSMCDKN